MATIALTPRQTGSVEVVSNPEIMGGWPCVAGTRIPAETILVYIRQGASVREIVDDYPTLPLGGVDAVRRWAEREGKL